MDQILYCIAFQHDWRWTLAAGLVCVFGVGTVYQLLGRARGAVGARRRNLAILAAFTGVVALHGHEVGREDRQTAGEGRQNGQITPSRADSPTRAAQQLIDRAH
ncbi:MAG: hypothetical protein EON86_04200, partial [Brevundimonas sp.]